MGCAAGWPSSRAGRADAVSVEAGDDGHSPYLDGAGELGAADSAGWHDDDGGCRSAAADHGVSDRREAEWIAAAWRVAGAVCEAAAGCGGAGRHRRLHEHASAQRSPWRVDG